MKRLIRSRLSGLVLGVVALSAGVCSATTVTTPIRQFGLGTLGRAAYSPDGQTILTAGGARAYLWSVSTGQVIQTFSGHAGMVNSVAFSPDATKVLTGGVEITSGNETGTATLWDAATGAVIRTFSGHTYSVNSVAFSPDGTKVLTGSSDGTAKLWDAATGGLHVTIRPEAAVAAGARWSVDGGATWRDSGAQAVLPVGPCTVRFKAVTGRVTPADRSVTIVHRQTTQLSVYYNAPPGVTQLSIVPA